MVTGVDNEVTHCSTSTSWGKKRKTTLPVNRKSAVRMPPPRLNQTKFYWPLSSWQITTILQNFHNIFNRISKLPKSFTTTMPTFDGKSEKSELFEDLFQTNLKIHNQQTEENRINYFHSLIRGDAIQTSENINGPTEESLGEILAVFRRKYV